VTVRVGVIGGGPVGLVSALLASRAGCDVTVFEPREGPVDKACGEGLMPGTLAALASLGLDPEGRDLTGVSYRAGNTRVDHGFPGQPGRGVRRTTLHKLLSGSAQQDGAVLVAESVVEVRTNSETTTLTTSTGATHTLDYVLACDGLHSPTAKTLGMSSPIRRPRRKRFGLRQHFGVAPWSSLIEVHYAPDVEVYVTPVADNEVGIAILGHKGLSMDRALAATPELAQRLKGATPTSPLRGAGPFPQRTRHRTVGRVLFVGDSSGYVDAITGEGLRVGFEQARMAVGSIVRGRPGDYEHLWRVTTRDFRILTSGLTALATSPLRGSIVPLAAAMPRVFGHVVNRLAQ